MHIFCASIIGVRQNLHDAAKEHKKTASMGGF